jgi:hypothetical protein
MKCVIRVVPVTVAPGARQLHALESLDGLSEQYVANAGRLVVAVWDAVVYVLQKVIAAAADAVKAEAQASVSGLSQANATGARAPRKKMKRMLTLFDDWLR